MGKRGKLITLLVLCAMLFELFGLTAYASKKDYTDLKYHWSYSMVKRLESYGIVKGFGDGTFRPDDPVGVDAFVKMTVCALGYKVEAQDGYWAVPYIEKAKEIGLIEDGEFFDYTRAITRSEMARISARALKSKGNIDENLIKSQIYDYAETPEDMKEYVITAYGEKLITGYDNNEFRPLSLSSRAEAVTVITRLIDRNGGIQNPSDNNGNTGDGTITSSAAVYVAKNGKDTNDGSINAPFATLKKAQECVRSMIAGNALPKGGVTVYLREGTYYMYEGLEFTEADSGTEDSPITYTSYNHEKVTLSGLMPIEASWFTAADDTAKKTVIDQKAVSNILVADLKAHGITDYGEFSTRGYHYFNKGRYAQGELVVNGENQTIARYPNEGTISVPTDSLDNVNLSFGYTDDRISKWKDAKDAWIVGTVSVNYENNEYPIAKIDTSSKKIFIGEGKIQSYYTNGWFFGENLLEEIDREGEYYIDRESGKLYYYAPSDFKTGNYTAGLTTLKTPLFNFNGTKNVKIRNLYMEGGRGYAVLGTSAGYKVPTFSEFLTSQKISLEHKMFSEKDHAHIFLKGPSNYPDAQVFPGHVWDGFQDQGKGVDGIEITNCDIRNFGSGGIIIRGDNVKIESNHIKNMGGVGLYLRGGDLETLSPSGNTIINNEIHRVGYLQRAYFPAIAMHGVAIHVAHNDIYDAPHCIFNYHGNDHIIEYNKIHEAVKECLDMDAIYTRNEYMPQWRGNIIRYNYIYDLGIYPIGEYTKQLNVSGIRTDNYGHGLQIYSNIFANIGTENANNVIGVTAQGNRNTLKGNIFVDCSATFLGWNNYAAGTTWDMNNAQEKERVELAEKYAANPIFGDKYPELKTFRNEYYKSVATNVFDENVVANIKFKLSETNGAVNPQGTRGAPELIKGTNNFVTKSDPGFTDYKNGNYTLKSDSEVFKKIPDFENIDMSKIGTDGKTGPQ